MQVPKVQRRKLDLGYLKRLADHELAIRLEGLESMRIKRKVQLDRELTTLRQTVWEMHVMLTKSLINTWNVDGNHDDKQGDGRVQGDVLDGPTKSEHDARPRAARRKKEITLQDPPIWHVPRPKYVDLSKDEKHRHESNEKSFILLVQKYRDLKQKHSSVQIEKSEEFSIKAKPNQFLTIPGLTRSKTFTWGTIPTKQAVSVDDWAASSVAISRHRTVDFSRMSPLEPITPAKEDTGDEMADTDCGNAGVRVKTEHTVDEKLTCEYVIDQANMESSQCAPLIPVSDT